MTVKIGCKKISDSTNPQDNICEMYVGLSFKRDEEIIILSPDSKVNLIVLHPKGKFYFIHFFQHFLF